MPTTVVLSERELAELKALTKQKEASAAVRMAMKEYLRYRRRLQLKKLSGRVHIQDSWQALERVELENGRKRGARAR